MRRSLGVVWHVDVDQGVAGVRSAEVLEVCCLNCVIKVFGYSSLLSNMFLVHGVIWLCNVLVSVVIVIEC